MTPDMTPLDSHEAAQARERFMALPFDVRRMLIAPPGGAGSGVWRDIIGARAWMLDTRFAANNGLVQDGWAVELKFSPSLRYSIQDRVVKHVPTREEAWVHALTLNAMLGLDLPVLRAGKGP